MPSEDDHLAEDLDEDGHDQTSDNVQETAQDLPKSEAIEEQVEVNALEEHILKRNNVSSQSNNSVVTNPNGLTFLRSYTANIPSYSEPQWQQVARMTSLGRNLAFPTPLAATKDQDHVDSSFHAKDLRYQLGVTPVHSRCVSNEEYFHPAGRDSTLGSIRTVRFDAKNCSHRHVRSTIFEDASTVSRPSYSDENLIQLRCEHCGDSFKYCVDKDIANFSRNLDLPSRASSGYVRARTQIDPVGDRKCGSQSTQEPPRLSSSLSFTSTGFPSYLSPASDDNKVTKPKPLIIRKPYDEHVGSEKDVKSLIRRFENLRPVVMARGDSGSTSPACSQEDTLHGVQADDIAHVPSQELIIKLGSASFMKTSDANREGKNVLNLTFGANDSASIKIESSQGTMHYQIGSMSNQSNNGSIFEIKVKDISFSASSNDYISSDLIEESNIITSLVSIDSRTPNAQQTILCREADDPVDERYSSIDHLETPEGRLPPLESCDTDTENIDTNKQLDQEDEIFQSSNPNSASICESHQPLPEETANDIELLSLAHHNESLADHNESVADHNESVADHNELDQIFQDRRDVDLTANAPSLVNSISLYEMTVKDESLFDKYGEDSVECASSSDGDDDSEDGERKPQYLNTKELSAPHMGVALTKQGESILEAVIRHETTGTTASANLKNVITASVMSNSSKGDDISSSEEWCGKEFEENSIKKSVEIQVNDLSDVEKQSIQEDFSGGSSRNSISVGVNNSSRRVSQMSAGSRNISAAALLHDPAGHTTARILIAHEAAEGARNKKPITADVLEIVERRCSVRNSLLVIPRGEDREGGAASFLQFVDTECVDTKYEVCSMKNEAKQVDRQHLKSRDIVNFQEKKKSQLRHESVRTDLSDDVERQKSLDLVEQMRQKWHEENKIGQKLATWDKIVKPLINVAMTATAKQALEDHKKRPISRTFTSSR